MSVHMPPDVQNDPMDVELPAKESFSSVGQEIAPAAADTQKAPSQQNERMPPPPPPLTTVSCCEHALDTIASHDVVNAIPVPIRGTCCRQRDNRGTACHPNARCGTDRRRDELIAEAVLSAHMLCSLVDITCTG